MVASKAARTRKLSSFVSKNKCRTLSNNAIPFSRFCFPFHLSLSLSFSFQFHLAGFLTRSFRRETSYETVLLNLCLLINPTRSPCEIFISLVPRLFALVNLQSLAFKESLKISLQTWKNFYVEMLFQRGCFEYLKLKWWRGGEARHTRFVL